MSDSDCLKSSRAYSFISINDKKDNIFSTDNSLIINNDLSVGNEILSNNNILLTGNNPNIYLPSVSNTRMGIRLNNDQLQFTAIKSWSIKNSNITPDTSSYSYTLTESDNFGKAIKIYKDFLIVGSPGMTISASNLKGAVIIYKRSTNNNQWTQSQLLIPVDNNVHSNNIENFGSSIAINDTFLVVGSPKYFNSDGISIGRIWVYKYNSNTFELLQCIINPESNASNSPYDFSHSLSIYENNIFIGAPGKSNNSGAIYIYNYNSSLSDGSSIILSTTINDPKSLSNNYFGISLMGSKGKLYVGSYGISLDEDNKGGVWLIEKDDTETWSINNNFKLNNIVLSNSDRFGESISISEDYLVVGAPGTDTNQGSIHIIDSDNNGITIKYTDIDNSGSIANFGKNVDIYGNYIVISTLMNNNGIYIFKLFDHDKWKKFDHLISSSPSSTPYSYQSLCIYDNELAITSYNKSGSIFIASGDISWNNFVNRTNLAITNSTGSQNGLAIFDTSTSIKSVDSLTYQNSNLNININTNIVGKLNITNNLSISKYLQKSLQLKNGLAIAISDHNSNTISDFNNSTDLSFISGEYLTLTKRITSNLLEGVIYNSLDTLNINNAKIIRSDSINIIDDLDNFNETGNIFNAENLIMNTNMIHSGHLNIKKNLNVNKNSIIYNDVILNGSIDLLGNIEIKQSEIRDNINANTIITNKSLSISNNVLVTGNVNIRQNLVCNNCFNKNNIIASNLSVSNNTIVNDVTVLNILKTRNFNFNEITSSNFNYPHSIIVSGDIITNKLSTNNYDVINGNLFTNSSFVNISNTLSINNNIYLNNLNVGRNLIISNSLNANNKIIKSKYGKLIVNILNFSTNSSNIKGLYSTNFGDNNLSSGKSSFVSGNNSSSSGELAVSIGKNLKSLSYSELVLGVNNTEYIPISTISSSNNDRIFTIGNGNIIINNGVETNSKSDALIIFKSGDTKINNSINIKKNMSFTNDNYNFNNNNINISNNNFINLKKNSVNMFISEINIKNTLSIGNDLIIKNNLSINQNKSISSKNIISGIKLQHNTNIDSNILPNHSLTLSITENSNIESENIIIGNSNRKVDINIMKIINNGFYYQINNRSNISLSGRILNNFLVI